MKAIIPVAGMGTRLRPHTHTVPKVLLPVAGRPILGHILAELEKVGIDEITFIIGYRGDQVRSYVDGAFNFKTNYVEQQTMEGLGQAISLAAPYHKAGEPVLIILGDTIFRADLKSMLASDTSILATREVEDPRRFGVIELADDGERVARLIEKPADPPSNLVIVGIYYMSDSGPLFAALDDMIAKNIRTKNEYQLTDALQMMLDGGHVMKTFPIEGWHDCGKRETLLETNRSLLDMGACGGVDVSKYPESVIIPPVTISPSATIERSVVGPHVSIGDGAMVKHSVIADSILAANAEVTNVVLTESVISDNARVTGGRSILNVGDSSEVDLG